MKIAAPIVLALGSFGAGCDDGDSSPTEKPVEYWIDDVEQSVPEWLSETGIYTDFETFEPGPGFRPYRPPHALWSNAADKVRLIRVPESKTIDTTDVDHWVFPVGTALTKTFSYDDIEGRDGAVAVETRLLFKRADGWDYAVYRWNSAGTAARLSGGNWPAAEFDLLGAGGDYFRYDVPGRIDCRGCHETQGETVVIGFSSLNLDPELADSEIFAAPPELADFPARSPEEAAVMGYLVGNCVHCHHGLPLGDNASFSMLPKDLVANTVDRPTESSASGIGTRIVPNDAEGSALYEAVVEAGRDGYRGDFKPMPPLGITTIDDSAAEVLRAWIETL